MTQYAVRNLVDGEVVVEYHAASDSEIEEAVAAAANTASIWASTSLVDRAAVVRRVGALHLERRADLAAITVREMGKPLEEALGEVDFAASIHDYYADNADRFLADETVELLDGQGSAVLRPSPFGVLLGVMPWNFPYYQVARFAAPNLAAGNTVLLKHAPQCPGSAAAIAQMYADAGTPTGSYVNVLASNEQVATMIADPRVRGVSLTGSERAGAAVAQIAGRHLKKVVLELGGSDPFLVLGTDNLDAVIDAAVAARLENTGQACNAAKRFIVVEELYEAFVEQFTERLLRSGTKAPLSSAAAAAALARQVDGAVAQGATLTSSGERDGAHFPAGVLTGVTPDFDVYSQELFGPVAMVFAAASEEDAVRIANDTPYGLGSYVFTDDDEQAQRVVDRLDVGMVFVNVVGAEGPELPFGGTKRSGFGRELGRKGMQEFVNLKLIRTGGPQVMPSSHT